LKKLKRIAILVLVSALVLVVIPPTKAEARPKSIEYWRIYRYQDAALNAHVQIGDMVFKGQLRNRAVTEAELEKFIRETLAEMNLSDEEFDALNWILWEGMSQEESNKVRDAAVTAVGLLDPTDGGAIGATAKFGQMIDQLGQGDYSGAGGSYFDLVSKFYSYIPAVALGQFCRTMNDLSGLFEHARGKSGQYGMATTIIADFYRRLNSKLHEKAKDNEWALEFIGSIASKQFSFFDTQCTEIWMLNMILPKTSAGTRNDFCGTYEGTFTINIEYDISGFHDNLETIAEKFGIYEWQVEYAEEWGDITPPQLTVTNRGTSNMKRTISGDARVNVPSLPRATINMFGDADVINARIDDVVVYIHSDYVGSSKSGHEDFESFFRAEGRISYIQHRTDWLTIYSNGDRQSYSRYLTNDPEPVPLPRSIWARGDKMQGGVPDVRLTISYP